MLVGVVAGWSEFRQGTQTQLKQAVCCRCRYIYCSRANMHNSSALLDLNGTEH